MDSAATETGPARTPGQASGDLDVVYDIGLQTERTALAWDRTALAMVVAGALFLRSGHPPYHHPRHLPGAIVIGVGAILLVLAYLRYDARRVHLVAGARIPVPGLLVLIGTVTTAFSLATVLLVVFGG